MIELADKNIQMKRKRSDGGFDNHYPVTKVDNVLQANGQPITRDYVRQPGYAVTAGSGNTFTVSTNPAPTEYVDGMCISFKANRNNTGSATVNWNSLGARSLRDSKGNLLTSGKIVNGVIYSWRYNASNSSFILQGEGGEYGNATASQVLAGRTIGTEDGIVTGTMTDRSTGNHNTDAISRSGNTLRFSIPGDGFYGNSANIQRTDNNWIEANIREGIDMFGKIGALKPSKYATGTKLNPSSVGNANSAGGANINNTPFIHITGLSFKPKVIILRLEYNGNTENYMTLYSEHSLSDVRPSHVITMSVGDSSGSGRVFQVHGNIFINETEFQLPTSINTPFTVRWHAYA